MIGVQINEPVVIHKTVKNDQGTLIIGIQEYGEVNPLEALNQSGQTSFEKAEKDITIWPIKKDSFNGTPLSAKELMDKVAEVKNTLNHILSAYTPSSNIKWDLFKGTNVTTDNYETAVVQNLDKMYNNLVDQFITQMKPFLGKNPVRILLIRQSAAKHYPTFRKRYLDSQPFIEPITVPKAASKVKFSKYEIEKGLNNGEPTTGSQIVSKEEVKEAEELFS